MSFDIVGHLRIIDNATRPLRNMTAGLLKFGVAAAGIGAVASTVAVFGNSLKKAMDFEEQMQSIKALTGVTATEMARLNALALEQGAKTKYSALEAAQGMEELLKAGLSVSQVEGGALNAALNLATAGSLGLADAAEIMSTALNAFRDDNMTAAQAADILAGTANASATSVEELRLSLQAVSAVAAGVGLTFADTNVALGLFANNGVKSSDAGTSLKTMLANLVPMTGTAYDVFSELNLLVADTNASMEFLAKKGIKSTGTSIEAVTNDVERYVAGLKGVKAGTNKAHKETQKFMMANNLMHSAFYDNNGQIKKLADIADLLRDRLSKLTNEQRQMYLYQLFGSDAIRAGTILYKEGAAGVQKFYDEMGRVTALQVAEEKMNSAAGAIEQFRGAVETLQISALTPLMPIIRKLAGGAAELVAEYTPQITAAVEDMVNRASKYVSDNFINNPEFTNLPTLHQKVDFIFGKAKEAFDIWWSGGGEAQIKTGVETVVTFILNTLEASIPRMASIGLKLGSAIAAGILDGINPVVQMEEKILKSSWMQDALDWTGTKLPTIMGGYDNDTKYYDIASRRNKLGMEGTPMSMFADPAATVKDASSWAVNKALGHSAGLDRVPYNNYPARLHQDEMVLTSQEARDYRSNGGNSAPNITIHATIREDADIQKLARELSTVLAQ